MKIPGSILIVRLSSLGDIIHALPAFHALRASFPDARIDWVVERKLAFLLSAVQGIDEVIPIDTRDLRSYPSRASWRRLWQPIRLLRARRYDIAIDFQGLLKTAFLCLASGAHERIGFSRDLVRERPAHWFYHRTASKPSSEAHVARLNMLLSEAAGAAHGELCAHLHPKAEDVEAIEIRLRREQLSEFIVINPGGGWPTKRWPPARYGDLAVQIQKRLGIRSVVATGPGEETMYEEIARHCKETPPIHFPVPFLQLVPLFMKARVVIGGDTGPMHLACAVAAPVVAVMGPTSPVRNGPWSERDEVVVRRLPCSFCYGRSCPTNNECMDISADEVYEAVVRRLEKAR